MPGVLLCCLPCQAHRGAPLAGARLCRSVHQALKGAPWVGSYSVVQCIRHLMGQPLYCLATSAGLWGQRGHGDGSTLRVTQQYRLASMAAWLSSTGISHHNLLPHTPSICLSSQQQPSPWDCPTIPKLQFPATAPSRGPVSLSGVRMAVARTV